MSICCNECWNEYPESELVNIDNKWICGQCKETYLQRLQEGVQSPEKLEYAGFWIRVGAKVLDYLIFASALYVSYAIFFLIIGRSGDFFKILFTPEGKQSLQTLGIVTSLLELIFWLVIPTYMLGRFAATPGKMILGLKVIRSDSERLTYLRSFCRLLSEVISGAILCIGYIMVAFRQDKAGLHDIICDTRVIKK